MGESVKEGMSKAGEIQFGRSHKNDGFYTSWEKPEQLY